MIILLIIIIALAITAFNLYNSTRQKKQTRRFHEKRMNRLIEDIRLKEKLSNDKSEQNEN